MLNLLREVTFDGDKMENYDTHILDNLVGTYIRLRTGKYPDNRIMAKLVDFDYNYLLLETPKAHNIFIMYKGRITEIEPLSDAEVREMLNSDNHSLKFSGNHRNHPHQSLSNGGADE